MDIILSVIILVAAILIAKNKEIKITIKHEYDKPEPMIPVDTKKMQEELDRDYKDQFTSITKSIQDFMGVNTDE